jgi:thimet oligopeptidase
VKSLYGSATACVLVRCMPSLLLITLSNCTLGLPNSAHSPKPEAQHSSLSKTAKLTAATPAQFSLSEWYSAESVQKKCADDLKHARSLVDTFKNAPLEGTVDDTLQPYNWMLILAGQLQNVSTLMAQVHPLESVRAATDACSRATQEFMSEVHLNPDVFTKLGLVAAAGHPAPDTARFLHQSLLDYKRAGVDRDADTRAKLARVKALIQELEQTYLRNIREATFSVKLEAKEAAGLPSDFVAAKQRGEDGSLVITNSTPDVVAVMNYARSEALRKAVVLKMLALAYPENEAVLLRLLAARNRYATILGYSDWADYVAEISMANRKQTVETFLATLAKATRPRLEGELRALMDLKKADNPEANTFEAWDAQYYTNRLNSSRLHIEPAEARKYFGFESTKKGVMHFVEQSFSVKFRRVEDHIAWHESVEVFDVCERMKARSSQRALELAAHAASS